MSPACQPYTILNPNAKGALDPRAKSFLHLIQDVLPTLAADGHHPSYILVENVAGFEKSSTREVLVNTLHELDYHTTEFLLSPSQYGIPNSRLRYYLLARKTPFCETTSNNDGVVKTMLGGVDEKPTSELRRYLDSEQEQVFQDFKVPDRILEKWGRLFDIVLPYHNRSCCFTRGNYELHNPTTAVLTLATE